MSLIEYKHFFIHDKTLAEAYFWSTEGNSDRQSLLKDKLIIKKIQLIAIQAPKLCNKLKSIALNSNTGVLYSSDAEQKTI